MKKIVHFSKPFGNLYNLKKDFYLNNNLNLKNSIRVNIINACGEWDDKKDFFNQNNIEVIDINFSYFKFFRGQLR